MKKKEIIEMIDKKINESSTEEEFIDEVAESIVKNELIAFTDLFNSRKISTPSATDSLIKEFYDKWVSIVEDKRWKSIKTFDSLSNSIKDIVNLMGNVLLDRIIDLANFKLIKLKMEKDLKRDVSKEEVIEVIEKAKKKIKEEGEKVLSAKEQLQGFYLLGSLFEKRGKDADGRNKISS